MIRRARVTALVGLGALALLGAGMLWLAREDALAPCPVIAALNGDQPARVDEAARLHSAASGPGGVAPAIWLTNDPRSGNADTVDAGTDSNVKRLLALGIPRAAIEILPGAAINTHAELEIIRHAAEGRGASCVIVVTSPWHVARVKATWLRTTGTTPRLVVRRAPGAQPVTWWAAAKQVGGTLAALIGLPR
jgi:uncharacterized SAM-binding protein YcdF (DUF218 family)